MNVKARRPRCVPSALPLLALALAACAPATPSPNAPSSAPPNVKTAAKPESTKVTWKRDSSPKSCHTGDKGTGDLVAGVTAMATACVQNLRPLGTPFTGNLTGGAANIVTTMPLKVHANHCYRFFGLAESTVSNLDIAVLDSEGKVAGEEATEGNDAVVLEDGAICFLADDDVHVNVAVAHGSGKFAMGVWSD